MLPGGHGEIFQRNSATGPACPSASGGGPVRAFSTAFSGRFWYPSTLSAPARSDPIVQAHAKASGENGWRFAGDRASQGRIGDQHRGASRRSGPHGPLLAASRSRPGRDPSAAGGRNCGPANSGESRLFVNKPWQGVFDQKRLRAADLPN